MIVIFLLCVGLLAASLRMKAFEVTFLGALLSPVVFYLLAFSLGADSGTYWVTFGLMAGVFWLCAPRKAPVFDAETFTLETWFPFLVFSLAFLFSYLLTQEWPDFIAMGERLRDYAILASVLHDPINVTEPWMPSEPLYYYAYWYRLGHLLHSVFDLPVWEVYHQLQSFTFALLIAVLAEILRSYLGWKWWSAVIAAFTIAFGSNVAGIVFNVFPEGTWWGPSRVIKGAINEFPAWSFLLGDLHPHFLNLPLLPFLLLLVLSIGPAFRRPGFLAPALIWWGIIPPLVLYNSNAWDVPLWLGFLFLWAVLSAVQHASPPNSSGEGSAGRGRKVLLQRLHQWAVPSQGLLLPLAGLLFGVALVSSLYLSSRNINPSNDKFALVWPPIDRTTFFEMGQHFGIPLVLLVASLFTAARATVVRVAAILCLASALLFKPVLPLLLVLLVLVGLWTRQKLRDDRTPAESLPQSVWLALSLGTIGLLILPELIFLNDPYGGENERMNTIFKIYSANWSLLHLVALVLAGSVLWPLLEQRRWTLWTGRVAAVGVAALMLAFFILRIPERSTQEPSKLHDARGLWSVDREFPGARDAILALEKAPRGLVLEAQGNPYSYTSHVSTLGGQPAFLGWANHVELLTRNYAEANRRKSVTDEIYRAENCDVARSALLREHISYLVWGPLEKKAYGEASAERFSCLTELVTAGGYFIGATGGNS